MTVLVIETAPESIRGELTRWFLELKPGVFVGKVNSRIRELLWKRICETKIDSGAVIAYSYNNEQGFEMKICGEPRREIVDFDGIQLVRLKNQTEKRKGEETPPEIEQF